MAPDELMAPTQTLQDAPGQARRVAKLARLQAIVIATVCVLLGAVWPIAMTTLGKPGFGILAFLLFLLSVPCALSALWALLYWTGQAAFERDPHGALMLEARFGSTCCDRLAPAKIELVHQRDGCSAVFVTFHGGHRQRGWIANRDVASLLDSLTLPVGETVTATPRAANLKNPALLLVLYVGAGAAFIAVASAIAILTNQRAQGWLISGSAAAIAVSLLWLIPWRYVLGLSHVSSSPGGLILSPVCGRTREESWRGSRLLLSGPNPYALWRAILTPADGNTVTIPIAPDAVAAIYQHATRGGATVELTSARKR